MSDPLSSPSVQRVKAALGAAGSQAEIVALAATARTAEDAAASIGCALGAIIKSLVFDVDDRLVLALVAGDRRCDAGALARAFGVPRIAARADARRVRDETGFAIGGVAPLAHQWPMPTAIDPSLGRFAAVYASAGHPHCVFATTVPELIVLTGGRLIGGLGVEA